MYYNYAEKFWTNALQTLIHGGFKKEYTIPNQILKKQLDDGKYQGREAGTRYVQDVENCRDLSRLWGEEESCNLMTILNRAFQEFSFSDQTMEKVASLLANETIITRFEEIDAEKLSPPLWSEDELTMLDIDEFFEEDSVGEKTFGGDPFRAVKTAQNSDGANASEEASEIRNEWTPKRIYEYLDSRIIGQEEAKRAASLLLYNHLHKKARNLAIAGPTGAGKTEIWRVLSERFDFIRIVDASNIGPAGWKASMHIADIFEGLPRKEAERLIIVWDEFDKACEPAIGVHGTDFARLLQGEMLRLLDGDSLEFRTEEKAMMQVNCKNISNVFTGSFENMLRHKNRDSGGIGFGAELKKKSGYAECTPDDLVKYGNVRLEIAGRIMQVVTMTPLTKEDFVRVLADPGISPLVQAQRGEKFQLHMNEETRERIAEKAVESGMGARYLRAEVQRRLDARIFENPEATEMDLSDEEGMLSNSKSA